MAALNQYSLISSTLTTTTTGSVFTLDKSDKTWVARITCGTVTGTNPTLDVIIQHSLDNTNYVTIVTFTQIIASNAAEHKFMTTSTDYLRPLFPFVKAVATIGGTATPTFNSVAVILACDS